MANCSIKFFILLMLKCLIVDYFDYAYAQGPPMPPGGGGGVGGPQPPAADGGGGGGYQKSQYQPQPQQQYQPQPQPQPQQYGGYQPQPQPQPQQYGGQQPQQYGGGGGSYVPPPPFPLPPPAPMTCDLDPNCWQYAVDCSAADAYPFERHSCGSCEECLALCMKNQAKPPATSPLGIGPATGGGCGGGCPQQQPCGGGGCQQQQQQYGGGCGGGGGGGCPQQRGYGGGGYQGKKKRQAGGAGGAGGCNGPCPYYCQSVVFDAQYKTCDLFAVNAPKLKKYPGRAYFQSTGLCTGNKTQNATSAPAAASCPDGQTAKIIAVKGYTLSGFSGKDAPGVTTEDACTKACLTNQLPDGTPITCKSAQFTGGKCQISQDEGKQSQDVKQGDGTYLKKYCFPTDLVKNCPDVWEEDPQKILVGQNKLTVDASTYDQCLTACLNSQKDNGFVCKSGMFFFQETKLNCILNVESKTTKPDLFTDASADDVVVYFDPNCGGSRLAKKKTKTFAEARRDLPLAGEWTLWSPCEGTWLTQVRFRQCGELDPRDCEKQERPCDPSLQTTEPPSTSTTEKRTTTAVSIVLLTDEEIFTEMKKSKPTTKKTMVHNSTFPVVREVHRTTTKTYKTYPTTPLPPIESTPEFEEEPKGVAEGRLVDTNEVRRADAAADDGSCRALRRNGIKNCRLGVRIVGGLKRYCSSPIDC